ncbi:MAG: ABC transporter substrate-binding protein [Treponema sp.]|uniref:ABC transporter substrate-binding protein n=1 Tax=Treponema sp. TaxID=166 RepID=UPI00298E385F|nr:ABC transporter substrate-binding protein [Treponema sp.]MDD5812440.1 ABC transporter substrate-binding protein [Treponema sp.]
MKKRGAFLVIILTAISIFTGCKGKKVDTNGINRIVSLGPSATEILFAIGADKQLVACTDFCDYPAEAKTKASVGGFAANSISLESIISYEPDLVYLFSGMHDSLIKPLQDMGISVYVSKAASVDDVKKEIIEIGTITGHSAEAEDVVKEMNLLLAEARNKSAEAKKNGSSPLIYWQVWDDPLMTAGKNSFINDIITLAGGINIFGEENSDYPIISDEAVIAAKPQFIFITKASDNYSVTNNKIMFYAMKKDSGASVHYVNDDKFSRPGPRCAEAVQDLTKILYGLPRK